MPNSSNTTNTTEKGQDNPQPRVSSEFSNFLADIEQLLKETTSLTGDDLARARAELHTRIDAAKASAVVMGDSVVQKARQSATVTDEFVHEQPWKAVATGTAIGLLVGLLIGRRN